MKTSLLLALIFSSTPAWAMTKGECQSLLSNAERQAVANSIATLSHLRSTLEVMPSPAPEGHPAVPVVDAANKLDKESRKVWSGYVAALDDYCQSLR